MISVIVPVYNVEKYLRKCVESILNQTYTDLEVILVDDGSTDNCPQICDGLAALDSRIRVVHKSNGGLSSARNAGIDIAKGEYVGFVDSDDTINPQMYERMLQAMSATNADISMCGCNTVADSGIILAVDRFAEGRIYEGDELICDIVFPLKTASWNKMFRRKVIRAIRFPEGKIHGEDLVFFVNAIGKSTTLVTTEYTGYNYFKRANSITTSMFSKSAFDEIWCKEAAAKQLNVVFPKFKAKASLWSFRARMNILRAITKAGAGLRYASEVDECEGYVKRHYNEVKGLMRWRERLEYALFRHCRVIYNGVWVLIK